MKNCEVKIINKSITLQKEFGLEIEFEMISYAQDTLTELQEILEKKYYKTSTTDLLKGLIDAINGKT